MTRVTSYSDTVESLCIVKMTLMFTCTPNDTAGHMDVLLDWRRAGLESEPESEHFLHSPSGQSAGSRWICSPSDGKR